MRWRAHRRHTGHVTSHLTIPFVAGIPVLFVRYAVELEPANALPLIQRLSPLGFIWVKEGILGEPIASLRLSLHVVVERWNIAVEVLLRFLVLSQFGFRVREFVDTVRASSGAEPGLTTRAGLEPAHMVFLLFSTPHINREPLAVLIEIETELLDLREQHVHVVCHLRDLVLRTLSKNVAEWAGIHVQVACHILKCEELETLTVVDSLAGDPREQLAAQLDRRVTSVTFIFFVLLLDDSCMLIIVEC